MRIKNVKKFFVFIMVFALVGLFLVVFAFNKKTFVNIINNKTVAEETPSTYLTKLSLKGYEGSNPDFVTGEDGVYDYDLDEVIYTIPVFEDDEKLRLYYEKEYDGATVSINQSLTSGYATDDDGEYVDVNSGDGMIYIDVKADGASDSMYAIEYTATLEIDNMPVKNFDSTGGYQEYIVPRSGTYKIDLYGAPGGAGCAISNNACTTTYKAGQGAHTYGTITLKANDILYFYVGETGTSYISSRASQSFVAGGWNGGGKGYKSTNGSYGAGGGGGATDVRLVSGAWDDSKSLASRIMVAAGGGGGAYSDASATWSSQGGGLYVDGLSTTYCVANQTSGFSRGKGSDGVAQTTSRAGSGGGYFGGDGYVQTIGTTVHGSGCGGSSYISGHNGAIGVDSEGNAIATEARDVTDSYNYTGYVFLNTGIIDGAGHNWTTTPEASATGSGSAGGKATIQQLTKYVEVENYLSNITYSAGTLSPTFDSKIENYELVLDMYTSNVIIGGEVANSNLTSVSEYTNYSLNPGEEKTVQIFATDIASGNVRTYYVKVKRESLKENEHTTILQKIVNKNHDDLIITKGTTTYTLPVSYGKMSIELNAVPYDDDVKIEIAGNDFLLNDTGIITIKVSDENLPGGDTIYTLNYERETSIDKVEDEYDYDYTGAYKTFTVPMSGDYKLETWGAQGGSMGSGWTGVGGPGGYTAGIVNLTKGTKLYVYVGGKGTGYTSNGSSVKTGGYNGGGSCYGGASAGGGATDIRLISGDPTDGKSLNSRIIVAGGGGGANDSQNGGAGGGLIAETGVNGSSTNGAGGSQISGGAGAVVGTFGQGGYSLTSALSDGGAGGGGYYGGGKASGSNVAGGGGSSYISGYKGAIAVQSSTVSNPRKDSNGATCTQTIALDDEVCSEHYSGLVFSSISLLTGRETMPSHNGKDTIQGNTGNGYAKITPLSSKSENNFLRNITYDHGTINKAFDPRTYDYEITIGMYYQYIELDGIPYDLENATVTGEGKLKLDVGENVFNLVVTAENGETRIYTVTVIREGLKGIHSNALNYIDIKNVTTIFAEEGKYDYSINVPYNKYSLEVNAVPYEDDEEVKVTITGSNYIVNDTGEVKIIVSHESGTPDALTYTITYNRQMPLYEPEKEYTYSCTKSSKTFQAFLDGDYKLEVWGAAGGGANHNRLAASHGGNGGYSTGVINLKQSENLYIYVGCAGSYSSGLNTGAGWNGGGSGGSGGYGGGGASDIRYNGNNYASRIIVAGGGGGADNSGGTYLGSDDGSGGAGGGTTGENAKINGSYYPNTAGTQTTGYAIGVGGSVTRNTDTGGAGGGYFGGKVTNNNNGGAGGGSGYIDTTLLKETRTIRGDSLIPTFDGTDNMTGNSGNGYIKITPMNLQSENDYLSKLEFSVGTISPEFDPGITEYTITTDTFDPSIEITGTAADSNAIVIGNDTYDLELGQNEVTISVTSESGTTRVYNILVIRPMITDGTHTAELQKIKIDGFGDIICQSGVYEYDITVPSSIYYLDVKPIPYDSTSKQTISGFNYITESAIATITSRVTGQRITYKINIIKAGAQDTSEWRFTYKGTYQTFTAPFDGTFKLEVWGAQGGYRSSNIGGHGGYATGTLEMKKDEVLYIYVGGSGNTGKGNGGWNGGGSRGSNLPGGGGATDIRTYAGAWNDKTGLLSRILVAGGGGSDGARSKPGGAGGGTSGVSRKEAFGSGGAGATLTTAGGYRGTFGKGGSGADYSGGHAGAGGGGWYGGGGSNPDRSADDDRGGGGGSGFALTAGNLKYTPTNYAVGSDYYLTNVKLISGTDKVPNYYGTGTMTGNTGNGYAKITYAAKSDDNFLYSLIVKSKNETKAISPTFDPTKEEYTLSLDPDDTTITIIARPDDSTATVDGYGEFEVPAGTTTFDIKVTSESGKLRTYKLTVSREASTEIYPDDIQISGLVGTYCNMDSAYCNLNPSEFDKDTHTYSMTLPYKIRELNFNVVKKNANQVVLGGGLVNIASTSNATTYVTIQVQSEACSIAGDLSDSCITTYEYALTRDIARDNDLLAIDIIDPERSIDFDPDIYEYSTSIPYEYTKIEDLRYTASSDLSSVVISGNENMELGNNLVTFTVTSIGGDVKVYKLNVYREKSTVTYLSKLEFYTLLEDSTKTSYTTTPTFNQKNFGSYDIIIPYEVEDLYVDTEVVATELANFSISVSQNQLLNKSTKILPSGNKMALENDNHITKIPVGYSYVYITVTAQDGSTDTYKVRIVRKKDSISKLTSLIVKSGDRELTLDPEFDPETLEYSLSVASGTTSIDITAIPQSDKATVTYPNGKKIVAGDNKIIVRVTAQDGTYTDYVLNVNRPYNNSNKISSLKLTQGTTEYTLTPEFDPDVNEYSLTVPNNVTSLYLSAILESNLATLANNNKTNYLKVGENKIQLDVTSEAGEINTYLIKITRLASSDATLKTITFSSGDVIYVEDGKLEYELNVSNKYSTLTLKALPTVSTTTYTSTNPGLLDTTSKNTFKVITLAEDQVTTLTYVINVIRDKSNNANLSYLLMEEGHISPSFDPYVITYTATVPNEVTSGTFHIETENVKATYSIIDNDFSVGENIVKINVTPETGNVDQKTYTVKVIREPKENSSNYLSELKSSATLNPTFDKTHMYYEAEVPYEVTEFTVSGTAEDPSAEIQGLGTYDLTVGRNLIVITVVGTDNLIRDYQIVVTRLENSDARLANLSIEGVVLSPVFNSDTYEYNVSTSNEKLVFKSIKPIENKATYVVNGNSFEPGTGVYTVEIVVTAPNNIDTKTYIINVTKTPSSNAYLSSLSVLGYELSPVFNKTTTVYTMDVAYNVGSILVNATAENSEATVTGDGINSTENLVNNIEIVVTAGDGTEIIYTIVVNREANHDALLKYLDVENGTMTPEFNSQVFEYDVTVPYGETKLELKYKTYDTNSTSYTSSLDITNDTTVYIYVTAEDKTTKNTYKLNVKHDTIVSEKLKTLEIADHLLSPDFNQDIYEYDILLNNEETEITIDKIETLDPKATYKISNTTGFTEDDKMYYVYIDVTSSDTVTTQRYTLNVFHQREANNYLNYIYYFVDDDTTINFPEPVFNKTTLSYKASVNNQTKKITLNASYPGNVTVEGLGTFELETGVNIFTIKVTSNDNISRTYIVKVTKDGSNEGSLNSINLTYNGQNYNKYISPVFDSDVLEYTVNVPAGTSSLTVDGTISDKASVSGFKTWDISVGGNLITVIVTSESGAVKTYKFNVIRTASSDNVLVDLSPSDGMLDPNFKLDIYDFNLDLDSSVSKLFFDYKTKSGLATVIGTDEEVVPDGTSTRTIIVTAEDGSSLTYTIHINKASSNNAYLKSLKLNCDGTLSPIFDSSITSYNVIVPNSKTTFSKSDITAIPVDGDATITTSSTIQLSTTSSTEFTIVVTAADGETKITYRLFITREIGTSHTLKSLKIKSGQTSNGYLKETFKSDTTKYTYMIPPVKTSVGINDFVYTLTDSNSKVEYDSDIDLENTEEPWTFHIKVIAEDNSGYTLYEIKIVYDYNSDNTLSSLAVQNGIMKPAFKSGLYEYTVYEYETTTTDVITAKTSSSTAAILSGVGTVTLSGAAQDEYVVVKAEDGSKLTYTLHFINTYKTDTTLNNLYLNGLSELNCLKDYCKLSPTFSDDVVYYSISVPFEYYYLDLGYEFKNDEQSLKILNNNKVIENKKFKLQRGINEFEIKVYDGLGKLTTTYTLVVTRQKSSNTDLSSLKVYNVSNGKEYELSPKFNTNTYEYQMDIPNSVDEVKLTATTSFSGTFYSTNSTENSYKYVEDTTAIVKFNGYNQLQDGDNIVTATVTAPDGTVKQYVIHVIKQPIYNSWLSGISVSTGIFWDFTPEFSKINYTYYLTIPNQYDMVYIDATPEDQTTVVRGTGQYELNVGINTITLVSTAINGSVSTYKLLIYQTPDNNMDLKSLSLDECNINPNFDQTVVHYTCEVEPDEEDVTVHAVAESKNAKVTITGDKGLITGENVVEIQVLGQDKLSSKTYQVTVTRSINSNANLSDLKVTDLSGETIYPLNKTFNKNISSYKVNVPYDVNKVIIDPVKEVSTAQITKGKGRAYLNYGDNVITIEVLAEDKKTIKTYELTINRSYNLNLANIKTNQGDVSPTFTPLTTDYKMTVPNNVKQIYVTGIAEDQANIKVTGMGSYDLSTSAPTVVSLVTTDPLGNTKLYTVSIEREKNSNAYASAISMEEGALTPDFNKTVQEYTVNVHPNVTSVKLTVTPEVSTTTYEIIGNSNLKKGENEVKVKMIAENGDTYYYTLNVIVQDESFFANTLSSITLTTPNTPEYVVSMNPTFNKDINSYSVTLPSTVDVLNIDATPTISTATIEGTGDKTLESGINLFSIKVTGIDGQTNVYQLSVHRMEDDASLDELIVENHPFVFTKVNHDYNVVVEDDEDYLNIIYAAADPTADVTITGNGPFNVGENIVTITIETVTGKTEEYHIYVNKKKSSNPYLKTLSITDYEFTPEFDPTARAVYSLDVPRTVSSLYIEATPEDPKTTITGVGSVDVEPGTNTYVINTEAEDGTTFEYTIVVERAIDSNTYLKKLEVTPGTLKPEFNKTVYDYEVVLDEGATSIRINAEAESEVATVEGINTYYLTSSITTIPIKVTAENGDSDIYNVKVIKRAKASPYLAELSAEEGELNPVFDSKNFEYQIVVPYEVTNLNLSYATVDDDAIVSVTGNENFEEGSNEVTIRVLSSDNELVTYTLYVIRQPYAVNYLSTLSVTNVDKTIEYELTPEFDKNTLYYETSVPNSVSKVKISATLYDASLSLLSGTQTKNLTVGENRCVITVTSKSGYIRTYIVVINRNTEDEDKATNYLKTLTEDVEEADLSPSFDPSITTYTITVPSTVTSITFDATYPTGASVTGLGKSILKYGTSQRTITVKGLDDSVTNYYINITREYTDSTKVISITPSVGTLNYVDGTTEYEMEVPSDTDKISFDVEVENQLATVTGNEETTLSAGINVITITITGDDDEEKVIHIFVTKKASVENIILDKTEILIGVNESISIPYTIEPSEMNTSLVTWSVEDSKIATVATNGLITGVKPGKTIVKVTSDLNPEATDELVVEVVYKNLITNQYTIERKTESETDPDAEDYTYGSDPVTGINNYMEDFVNPTKYLHLYKSTGEEIDLKSTEIIGTGFYVTLEIDNKEYDRLLVVVKGDSNGDGYVTSVDSSDEANYILGKNRTWLKKVALDVSGDKVVSSVDSTLLSNYILRKITTFS